MSIFTRYAAAGAVGAILGAFASTGGAEAGTLGLADAARVFAPGAQIEQAHYRHRHWRHRYYRRYGYYPRYSYYPRPYSYYPSYGYYAYPAYSYPAYGPTFFWGW